MHLTEHEWLTLKEKAIRDGNVDAILKLAELESRYTSPTQSGPARPIHNLADDTIVIDQDRQTGEPTLRISVEHMVQAYVGHGHELKVNLERWGDSYSRQLYGNNDDNIWIVINLRSKSTGEITTIRDLAKWFPSEELRAKLTLLREDDPRKP